VAGAIRAAQFAQQPFRPAGGSIHLKLASHAAVLSDSNNFPEIRRYFARFPGTDLYFIKSNFKGFG
jgi:hypothetical protein